MWLSNSSVNVAQMLLGLIEKMNQTLSTHTHNSPLPLPLPLPIPIEKADFVSYKAEAIGLNSQLGAIVE
ncbi:hypothetical protein [Pseudoalteromonas sp. PB2-1]|uniref:hypothetical protein n=1 Tax=Pseudoalteromonas sp. PB2-1 TaxID=2907242 RepID=UPI00386B3198